MSLQKNWKKKGNKIKLEILTEKSIDVSFGGDACESDKSLSIT